MHLKVEYTRELFSARQTAQVGTANLCEQEGALSKDGSEQELISFSEPLKHRGEEPALPATTGRQLGVSLAGYNSPWHLLITNIKNVNGVANVCVVSARFIENNSCFPALT